MKKLYTLALFLISLTVLSQAPATINYQGVARNVSGAPITGTIGISITIHAGSATGSPVFTETYSRATNQFGIFELQIGSNTTGGLSNINWGANKYWLGVAIDPSGGTNYGSEISTQQFVSVPYALYAEKSGSSGPTPTIISNSDAIIVNNNFPNYNLNYTPPVLALNNDTILSIKQGTYTSSPVILKLGTASPTTNPTGPWGVSGTNVFLNAGGNNVGIGTAVPAAKLEVNTNTLSTNNAIAAYSQGGNGLLAITSSASNVNAAVMASNNGDGMGVIGNAVSTNGAISGVMGQNTGSGPGIHGANTSFANTPSAHGVFGETNSSAMGASGVGGINNGIGSGVYGVATSPNISSAGVYGQNTGNGHGVYGVTTSSSVAVGGVVGSNNGFGPGVFGIHNVNSSAISANGVRGETNGTSIQASGVSGLNQAAGAGVYGENNAANPSAGGHGVYGKTSNTSPSANGVKGVNLNNGAGVYGENSNTGPTSSAGHGVFGRANSSDVLTYGVYGQHMNGGTGVYGLTGGASINAFGVYGKNTGAGSGSGVYGETNANSGFAAGVYGLSTGNMPAMLARNAWGSSSFLASGLRAITNSTSKQAVGIQAENVGNGPAIQASLTSTLNPGSDNIAILLEHGHIKSTSAVTPSLGSTSSSGITPLPTVGGTINNATDVKGVVAINFTGSSASIAAGGVIDQIVLFGKPYTSSSVPVIVLTPTTDMQGLSYRITSVSNAGFTIRLYRTANSGATGGPTTLPNNCTFTFNYLVIE